MDLVFVLSSVVGLVLGFHSYSLGDYTWCGDIFAFLVGLILFSHGLLVVTLIVSPSLLLHNATSLSAFLALLLHLLPFSLARIFALTCTTVSSRTPSLPTIAPVQRSCCSLSLASPPYNPSFNLRLPSARRMSPSLVLTNPARTSYSFASPSDFRLILASHFTNSASLFYAAYHATPPVKQPKYACTHIIY